MKNKKKISVILPIYNEQRALPDLCSSLYRVLSGCTDSFEILFVNDGSTDGSLDILKELQKRFDHLKIIDLKKNYGQSCAMQAGFDLAEGDIVASMDADLENNPQDMLQLLEALDKGYDVVCGKRIRYNKSLKALYSWVGNRLFRLFLRSPVSDISCTMRVYKKKVIKDIVIYGSYHRYLPVLLHLKGYSICEISIGHSKREHGKSKYGFFNRFFTTFYEFLTILFNRNRILLNTKRKYTIKKIWT